MAGAGGTLTSAPGRRSALSDFHLYVILASVLFVALNLVLKKSMFAMGVQDGFFIQITTVQDMWMKDSREILTDPLYILHSVRLVIVSPFLLSWVRNWPPFLESIFLLPFLLPIALAKFNGKQHVAQLCVFLVPYALSFRTSLIVCGFAYLYLHLFSDKRSLWYFVMSALLSFLSSGVALAWLIVFWLCQAKFKVGTFAKATTCLIVATGLTFSAIQKLAFFSGDTVGYTKSKGIAAAIERNTITVSYVVNDTPRFAVYLLLAAFSAFFLFLLLNNRRTPKYLLLFFLASVPGFFFEGLSVAAYIMPIVWAMVGAYVVQTNGPSPALPT